MSQNCVVCPHCRGQMFDDGRLAGQVVCCPHCRNQVQMPYTPFMQSPIINTFEPSASRSYRTYAPKHTDIFAVICFASGLLGLVIVPIVCAPICYISAIISYFRLRENRNLKGHGLRITGAIFGILQILFLMWQFEFGFFAPR